MNEIIINEENTEVISLQEQYEMAVDYSLDKVTDLITVLEDEAYDMHVDTFRTIKSGTEFLNNLAKTVVSFNTMYTILKEERAEEALEMEVKHRQLVVELLELAKMSERLMKLYKEI